MRGSWTQRGTYSCPHFAEISPSTAGSKKFDLHIKLLQKLQALHERKAWTGRERGISPKTNISQNGFKPDRIMTEDLATMCPIWFSFGIPGKGN